MSAVFRASQAILISKLSRERGVAELLFWQLLIAALIFTLSTIASLNTAVLVKVMPGLVYLALVPGLLAFTL